MDHSDHQHFTHPLKKNDISLAHKKSQRQSVEQLIILNDERLFAAKKKHDLEGATNLLNKIHERIKQTIYISDRKRYYTFLSVYYGNLAFFKLIQGNLERTCAAFQNSIQNFQHIQGFLSNRQEIIVHGYELARMYLQYCAILSQLGHHKTAYLYAEKGLLKIIQCFRILKALCEQEIKAQNHGQGTHKKQMVRKIQKICFKQVVLLEAKGILEWLENLPDFHKLATELKSSFMKIMQAFVEFREQLYYWKSNEEINEKGIRRKLGLCPKDCKRNLLGLHKGTTIASTFNMGTLMTIKLRKLNISFICKKFTLLSLQKIKQFALIASVCYFTGATQSRFHEIQEDIESLKIAEKYEKLSKNQQIQKCKIMHLKSLEIAGKIAPEAQLFFTHLLNSFNKNYKPVLDQIAEQQSLITLLETTQQIYSQSQQEMNEASYQYGIITAKKGRQLLHELKRKSQIESSSRRRMFMRIKSWDNIGNINLSTQNKN